MKIREALRQGAEILSRADISDGFFDAEILLLHALKKEKTFLITETAYQLFPEEERFFFQIIDERASGKPVSYIIGEKEFMGLPFKVNENVLIPRPDTEVLVERVIEAADKNCKLHILDLCTGSGAIAVSLAYYLPQSRVMGVDISREALAIAEENAQINGVSDRADFASGDVLKWRFMAEKLKLSGKFDIITANPPYIKKDVIPGLMKDVKDFEPLLALDGGADGLDFYNIIIPECAELLVPGGRVLVEIGYDQGEAVSKLAENCGCFKDVRIIKDLAGLDRVMEAKRKTKKE